MKRLSRSALDVVAVYALLTGSCSSDNNSGNGAGGHGGPGGAATGKGGAGGDGGSYAGHTGGAGGSGTGGSPGSGGVAGSVGAGGSAAGGGGSLGPDAAIDAGCIGAPPLTQHNVCSNIASLRKGEPGFTITSPDFAFCGEIPQSMTCDGREFGTGTNPTLTWSGAPAGTQSFALLFKDIAILADGNPATERLGYHWAMWDIPASASTFPTSATSGYHSTAIPGALQWSGRNNYGFFPPCPNPFPRDDSRFTCSLVTDSYSFTLYALPVAQLSGLPAPDLDATTGMPTGNYVVKLGHYIESLSALAVAEYRGTSHAWATSFSPPPALQYPCSAASAVIDGGTPVDGGRQLDGGASTDADASISGGAADSKTQIDSGSAACLR